jgi:putative DNA primase/helicase
VTAESGDRAWHLAAARGDVLSDDAYHALHLMRWAPEIAERDPELAAALAEGDRLHPDDPRRWPDGPPPWEQEIDVDPDTTAAFVALTADLATAVPFGTPDDDLGLLLALTDGHRDTDSGNADRLLAAADGRLRFSNDWGKWLIFRSGKWTVDTYGAMTADFARNVARRLYKHAGRNGLTSHERERLFKWAKRSESNRAIRDMVELSRGAPGVLVDHHDLDQHPHLFNVRNGTIDLRTGQLRAHDPDDLLTMQAAVTYDPSAGAPRWAECLEAWQPDPAVRRYLQTVCGSGLTGQPVQHLFVNHGAGGNGKGAFYGAIAHVLGNYFVVPHKSLLVYQRHDAHDTVKARLRGARMVVGAETEAGDRLDESKIKELTGGDVLEARRMREDPWSFWPSHTLLLHTNYKPHIHGTDDGIWRRCRVIPWSVTIPDDRKDPRLADKLRGEASGILNWLVEGSRRFLADGLSEPAAVTAATAAYRTGEDTVARFLADRQVTARAGARTPAARLVTEHGSWCEAEGIHASAHYPKVVDRLRQMGGQQGRTGRERYWHNIAAQVSEQEF